VDFSMSRISFDDSDLIIIRLAFVWALLKIEDIQETSERFELKSEELDLHHRNMKLKLQSFIDRLDNLEKKKEVSEIFK